MTLENGTRRSETVGNPWESVPPRRYGERVVRLRTRRYGECGSPCYPSTLITTALNDERAPAWMALKHTATLQAAQSCDRPVILRATTGGGHGGNESDDAADFTVFVATQLGVKRPVASIQKTPHAPR